MPAEPKFLAVIGTRPEAIKLAPVIWELRKRKQCVDICVTGQHRAMLRPHLSLLSLKPDHTLKSVREEQGLSSLLTRVISGMGKVLTRAKPTCALVQGDTTSALGAALSAFHHGINIAHVEAGLRTYNMSAPYPEELNRRAIALLAGVHFAPTEAARQNLLAERIDGSKIVVTGNTVIDAMQWALTKKPKRALREGCVIVTAHRRENLPRLNELTSALAELSNVHKDVRFVALSHGNPSVARGLKRAKGVTISKPLDYVSLVHSLAACRFVITDSGGLQEEAATLGRPLLVLREATERAEAVNAGIAQLVPMQKEAIVHAVTRLLDSPIRSIPTTAFGDGHAATRIVDRLLSL